ncbi:DUF1206 domain-containing protein [Rhizobium sp. SSA_523]|uniref:DUF1206 domain-containing protein n=1 Tax=Rhizobium sp. SSA_523 TaxID=2952477 RepID=UPI002091ACD8|nr:DUF1206 domain-containing protein [Rhizobium sp. SSA_523]MCO5731366.1 DUF1206 domain-containing protein [Rhizobium sp. SSA_523]WKC22108.1 DUF1206 domain-containing protein [Rhizobium sp. SSA_523]
MSRTPNFEHLARSGYAARGVVFLLIAALALLSGVAGGEPDSKSAVASVLEQPLGRLWVALIGFGLLGFVAWRLAQALADSDGHGKDWKGLIIRLAMLGSAFTYIGLAVFALSHAILGTGGSGGSGEKGLASWVMGMPFGSYLVILIGIGFIIGGMVTSWKGITRRFERYLQIPSARQIVTWICIYGLVARGVVFAITGVLFAYAGFAVDAEQAGSIADALASLRQLPFGGVLYIILAAGLAAFGLYNMVEARYRVVRGPSVSDFKRPFEKTLNA